MEYIVIPNNVSDIDLYMDNGINTFIVGLKDYSINYPSVSIEEIKELSKKCKLFVSVNKNIFNSELDDVLSKLKVLESMNILGVLYYDLGILNMVIDNKLNIDLVWHQTHMVTNYNTCNFYYENGVKYGFLANEITLEEMIEVKKNTKMRLMVEVFGYPVASHSRRLLLSNYFKSIGKEKENRTYNLIDRESSLRIKENKDGATLLNGCITNGTRPLFDLINNNMDYLVLDMQEVDRNMSLEVVKEYLYIKNNIDKISDTEKENIISKMNELVGDNTNFFYKKTIYKVKRGDK